MKKSIKYAGIAAATLLTVAPIAAPVVSSTTTVQAADGDTDIHTSDLTADQVNEAVSSWQGTLVSKTYGSNSNNNGDFPAVADKPFTDNYNKYMPYATFKTTGLAQAMNSVNTNDATLLGNAQIKISAVGYNKVEDFTTYANSLQNTKGSITFTYTIQYVNPDTNATETTAAKTFTLTNSQASSDTSIAATFTTPYEVATGSNVANAKLSTSTDFQLKNKDGDKLTSSQIAMGNVYKNLAAAKTNNGSTDVYTKATFDADTYYQPMTITLTAGQFGSEVVDGNSTVLKASDIINGYNNGKDDYVFTVNGGTPTASNANYLDADGDTVTVIREIKAADNNSASWTTEDTKGVVTTKSDKQFYTLKNGNNDFISDRALAKNTAWQTNAVRTNTVTGEKQYRVGADEWIDANNVTFSDKATDNNNGEGAYTDVKALNGKVVTAGPSGFYYPLYDDNGKMISDRGVAGLSAWYTDKSAVNANGDIVYHVATGEWLQGKNATYTAY